MFALTHCKILPILSLSLILFFIIQFSSVRQTTFPPLMWCIHYDKLAHPVYKLKFETTNMRLCLLVNALFGKYRLDSFVYFVQLDILDDELVCVFYTNIRYYY